MSDNREDQLAKRLQNLDERLEGNRQERGRIPRKSDSTGFGNGLKMSSEFVAAVLVGAGIGYLIDRFFGTAPWAMIFFLLLGFVAGVLNVLRSAGLVSDPASQLENEDRQNADQE